MNPFLWTWKALTAPHLPNVACSFSSNRVAIAQARNHHGHRVIEHCYTLTLKPGLLRPSFDGINVPDTVELAATITQMVEAVGLAREKRWAMTLPEESTRTYLVSLDGNISGQHEIEDMLIWKLERLVGVPINELRVSHQALSSVRGQQRFLVTLVREAIAQEYERLFSRLGWHVGVMWPRPMSEAVWLKHTNALPNQILLSTSGEEFTVMILRNQEPTLLRTQAVAEDESLIDAMHRLLLFYRDRAGEIIPGVSMAENPLNSTLFEVLMIGNWGNRDAIRERVRETFGVQPVVLSSELLGFSETQLKADFSQTAAAAGLASLSMF